MVCQQSAKTLKDGTIQKQKAFETGDSEPFLNAAVIIGDPSQIFLLSGMNSSEETLRIELPGYTRTRQEFSVIETCAASHIKSLIIQQDKYDRYEHRNVDGRFVIIPETISRLGAVETIKINACIEELPVALSKLTNLKLLDLTGCYNLLSIPEEILEMKDLKIKIGDIISKASEVIFIKVPENGITQAVFSTIRSTNAKKIEQLFIRQTPSTSSQERFEIPDEITDLHELKMLSITGNVSSLLSWIGNMNTLLSLTVSYSMLVSLPENIGNLSNLTSLNLAVCYKLVSLPETIWNLSNLTSLNLSECSTFESLPSSIGNLSNLTSFNLSGCSRFVLPESIGNLSNLTSLILSGCENLQSLPERVLGISLTSLLLI